MSKKMTTNKDKFLVEYFGECWHECATGIGCHKCGMDYVDRPVNKDLSTPDGFFWLLGECDGCDWFDDFIMQLEPLADNADEYYKGCTVLNIPLRYVDPVSFRDAVYDFVKGLEG